MLVGVPPFMDDDKSKLFKNIIFSEPDYKYFGDPVNVSETAKDFISLLLAKNPKERIKSNDIPKHKWFKGINFEDILKLKVKSPYVPKIKSLDDYSNFDPEFLKEECFSPPRRRKKEEEYVLKNNGKNIIKLLYRIIPRLLMLYIVVYLIHFR